MEATCADISQGGCLVKCWQERFATSPHLNPRNPGIASGTGASFMVNVPYSHFFAGHAPRNIKNKNITGALNAIYRHGRLEVVESVFETAEPVADVTTVADVSTIDVVAERRSNAADLDEMSTFYLERGCWDNMVDEDGFAFQVDTGLPHRSSSDVLEHGGRIATERIAQEAMEHTFGGRRNQTGYPDQSPVHPSLTFRHRLQTHGASERSLHGNVYPVEEDGKLGLSNVSDWVDEASDLGRGRTTQPAARLWHESIDEASVNSVSNHGEQSQRAEKNLQSRRDAQSRRRGAFQQIAEIDTVTTRRPLERERYNRRRRVRVGGRRTPSDEEQFSESQTASQLGSEVNQGTDLEVDQVNQVHQDNQEWSAQASEQEELRQREADRGTNAKAPAEESNNWTKGLVFGRGGLIEVVGSALQWMRRLAQSLAMAARRFVPESVPQSSVENVLYAVFALAGVWLCKAALEAVLALGTALVCLFLVTRVLWAAATGAAPDVSGNRRRPRSSSQAATDWSAESDSRANRDRVKDRTGRRANRTSRFGDSRRNGTLPELGIDVRGMASEGLTRVRKMVAGFAGSDFDVLRMFDLAAESRTDHDRRRAKVDDREGAKKHIHDWLY